ncbi:MAG: hypothetical protein RR370_01840 [Synergistaceae bacterium]
MAEGLEIITLKQKVFSDIVKQDSIIRLIDENFIGEGDCLINKNFFQFFRVPETEEETRSYICCEINIPNLNFKNDTFREVIINIWVISHQDNLVTPQGTRIDLLGWEIEKLFNGSESLGIGEAKLVSNMEDSLDLKHRFRRLQFSVSELNRSLCNV